MITTKEELKRTKIHITSLEDSNKFQKRIIELGCSWLNSRNPQYLEATHLYIDSQGYISCSKNDFRFFQNHNYKEITLKDLFMQEKPQTFIAKGTPNLVKALIEDLKLLGYSTKENENSTSNYQAVMSDSNDLGTNIKSKNIYSRLYISSNNHAGNPKEVTFNLPQDYQKCIDHATSAMNYWIEVEKVPKKPTSTTITIGSNKSEVTIYNNGTIRFTSRENKGETNINIITDIISKFVSFEKISKQEEYNMYTESMDFKKIIGKFSLYLRSDIKFIQIGCWDSNNQFSIKELQQIIEEYKKLQ